MRPQFFPWLFDDRNAWEKSFADPRYNYELPMDCFMAIYQVERRVDNSAVNFAIPNFSIQLPLTAIPAPMPVQAFATTAMPFAAAPAAAVATPKEEPKQEGVLSQDEIDALLSGL
jgi:hypothetical protein